MSDFTHWIKRLDRWTLPLTVLCGVVTCLLIYPARELHPTEVASSSPDTKIFRAQRAIKSRMKGPVHVLSFVIEDPQGNMWRPESIRALKKLSVGLRESVVADRLWRYKSYQYQQKLLGMLSPTDLIERISPHHSLETLTHEQLSRLSEKIAKQVNESVSQLIIPSGQSVLKNGKWTSPALMISILADLKKIGGEPAEISLNRIDPPEERFGRQVLSILRAHCGHLKVSGVALDVNLSTQEQGSESGPYIGATLLVIMLLLSFSLRSYWAVTLMGLGLATLMIWLKGASNLIGLKSDPILSLIVPIAMISFGVDAGVHSIVRYQEERQSRRDPQQALIFAMVGTLGAISLAALTDLSAFLVNLLSDLESVRQFGIACAFALSASFVLLGVMCPLLLSRIERGGIQATDTNQSRFTLSRIFALIITSVATTFVVMSVVFVNFDLGLSLYGVYTILGVAIPLWFRSRKSTQSPPLKYIEKSHSLANPLSGYLQIKLSQLTRFIYAYPIRVSGCGLLLFMCALPTALKVRVEFDIRHLLNPNSELVKGLDHLDEHLLGQGGEPSSIYIEGPLTHPQALIALETTAHELRSLNSPSLARVTNEETRLSAGIIDFWEHEQQVAIQTEPLVLSRALLDRWREEGAGVLTQSDGQVRARWAADEVETALWMRANDATSDLWLATRFELQLANTQSSVGIKKAEQLISTYQVILDAKLKMLSPKAQATLTGGAISRQAELDAISHSMLVSLPIALMVCLLIVGGALRRIYVAFCCTFVLSVVIVTLFALMNILNYGLNFMSATLGALSIGIGIDYATHVVVRIREECDGDPISESVLVRAIGGTGLALLVSAASSILGFMVLGFAPMPLFAAYGQFTALMIGLSFVSSVTLLPALLCLPDRLSEYRSARMINHGEA